MKLTLKDWAARVSYVAGYGMVAASPAFAQIQQLTSTMDWIKTTLTGIGIVVIVIALMWTGFKMMFQHAKWSEVAHILIGGIFVGGAAAIGPQIFGGGN